MTIYLYALDNLADWEIAFTSAELNSQRFLSKPISLVTIANDTKEIITMGGSTILPTKKTENVNFEYGDPLILPGSDTWMNEKHQKIINLVPQLLEKNVTVAAICGATIALAQAGILNDIPHTSNDLTFLKMSAPNYSGESLYIQEPIAVTPNLITASGIAPLEFASEIFKNTQAMKPATIEAWYQLYKTQNGKYFHELLESLK